MSDLAQRPIRGSGRLVSAGCHRTEFGHHGPTCFACSALDASSRREDIRSRDLIDSWPARAAMRVNDSLAGGPAREPNDSQQ
jgi:hypothetical protein